jgi:hypothetical protein
VVSGEWGHRPVEGAGGLRPTHRGDAAMDGAPERMGRHERQLLRFCASRRMTVEEGGGGVGEKMQNAGVPPLPLRLPFAGLRVAQGAVGMTD